MPELTTKKSRTLVEEFVSKGRRLTPQRRAVLEALDHAQTHLDAASLIRLARELSPKVRVLVRCAYLRERPALMSAGADAVFSEEGEVALAMTEAVLRDLGAVPEQIDRERERVRAELFAGPASPDVPPKAPGQ